MKPREYTNTCVVMQDTAYTVVNADGVVQGLPRTAPLGVGRVVYLPNGEGVKTLPNNRVVAWAEGIGTISVNRNALAQRLVVHETWDKRQKPGRS